MLFDAERRMFRRVFRVGEVSVSGNERAGVELVKGVCV